MHTIDIPFMFDNLAAAPAQIGASPEDIAAAQPLATTMSTMLLTYATTGNPNGTPSHPNNALPQWPAYSLTKRDTMIWNTPLRVEPDPRGEERRFAAASPYRQPGTYIP
jgi:para-nitrobenzyl esterase